MLRFGVLKKALGIDASWTGLALVTYWINGETFEEETRTTRSTSAPNEGVSLYERLDCLGNDALEFIRREQPTSIAMEGYAFSSMNNREKMGELGGHLKWLLYKEGLDPLIVPPTTLKSFVTGSGSAKKENMLLHTFKRWGFEAPNNDVCDAYGLARLAWEVESNRGAKTVAAVMAKCERVTNDPDLVLTKKPRGKKKGSKKSLVEGD